MSDPMNETARLKEEIERLNEKSDIWEEECRKYAKQVERLREALKKILFEAQQTHTMWAITAADNALEGE